MVSELHLDTNELAEQRRRILGPRTMVESTHHFKYHHTWQPPQVGAAGTTSY